MRKTLVQLISVLAVAHLLVLAGLLGFLFGTDRLNAERIEQIASVLRGEFPTEATADAIATTQPAEKEQAETKLARAKEESDLIRRQFERQVRETQDRQHLVEAMMLEVTRRQESLSEEQTLFAEQQRKIREQRSQSGFRKELELLETSKPKMRRDLLRAKSEPDAVRLMMEMETRAGKQVINACKTPDEKAWIGRILHQIETLNDRNAAPADKDEQEAP